MNLRFTASFTLLALATGCGSTSPPAAPSTPAVSIVSILVGVPGNGSAQLVPGETRQLFALATQSEGSTVDVTNLATWQSSNPNLATVSPAGVVTAAAEGAIDVSATYKSVKGSLHVDVNPPCRVTVTPASAAFNAFGGSGTVTVTASASACAWTARTDAAWFPIGTPSGTGSLSFTYTLPANSTPSARTATITVSAATGVSAVHAITEDKPLGCSYVTVPEELTFPAGGGHGEFTVIATPADCQWNTINGLTAYGVSLSSGFSGRGTDLVQYNVPAQSRSVDVEGYIEIAGLSGLNPNGRHHVILLKR
jgi:hypothetical protein